MGSAISHLPKVKSRVFSDLASCCLPGADISTPEARHTNSVSPVVIQAKGKHTATMIFLHGLGDTGREWASTLSEELPFDHIKYICPNAPLMPVTMCFGMQMTAWFDIYGITPDTAEDEDGITAATKMLHSIIHAELRSGIPTERIVVGGFSMGGALALYGGLTFDQSLAGIVGLSSYLVQRSKLPGGHTVNKKIPIFMGHGGADPMVPLTFAEMSAEFLKKFDENTILHVYSTMSHECCNQEMGDVKAFLIERLPAIRL